MADQEERQELEQVEQSVRETENELLRGAFEPKPAEKAEEPAPKEEAAPPGEPPAEEQAKPERKRDPATGQFVRAGEPAPPTTEQTAPQSGGQEKPEEVLPSWRAREINEERRAVQQEAERLRVENARLQAWVAQQQRAAQPKQEPQLPDPVLDPAAYTKAVQDSLRREFYEKQMSDRLEMNLELTHAIHGPQFEKAFEAVCAEGQRGNNALVRHLVNQPHPGRAIMNWFNDVTMRQEVGGDINAYRAKTREELLNDPKFLAEAAERARQVATGQVPMQPGQPAKPNTVVRMPPSLSRATGTAGAPETSTDGSEAAIFANAFRR